MYIIGITLKGLGYMAHERKRAAEYKVLKLAKFWPVVGLLGLRQVGKSTLLRNQLNIDQYVTLDDEDIRDEIQTSAKNFLARYTGEPLIIDEVQKEPKLFDAIKSIVDKKRIPGQWLLSGSVAFSAKIGIQESLTGRIGLVHLFPMTLSELNSAPQQFSNKITYDKKIRFKPEELAQQMHLGGLPLPAFIRNEDTRYDYWKNWLETAIVRDLSKAYGKGFDSDYAFTLLNSLARALPLGENPSLSFYNKDPRKAKKYIQAMEAIFLLRRFTVVDSGVGKDFWLFGDSGLASYLSPQKKGDGYILAITRHAVYNEIFSHLEYNSIDYRNIYFKSAKGSLVDFVINNVPYKVVTESNSVSNFSYHERSVVGAMKALGSKKGFLLAPIQKAEIPKRKKQS